MRLSCPTAVETQLESLKALTPGWFEAETPAYDASALDGLSSFLVAVLDEFQLPRPYIYPTPEGVVRAEWSGTSWEVGADFHLSIQQAHLLATRVDSDDLHELTVPLTAPDAASRLGRFLHDHTGH